MKKRKKHLANHPDSIRLGQAIEPVRPRPFKIGDLFGSPKLIGLNQLTS